MWQTLKDLWCNFGQPHPWMSTVAVMLAAGAAWWIFGGLVFLTTPRTITPVAESSADHHLRALKRKSQNLAGQIFDFLKEWERNESRTSGHLGEIWGKKEFDPEAFGKAFGEAGDLTRKYSDEMSLKFAKQFAGRVGNLRDELANEGFESAELDKKLQDRLRFKWDIQTVTEELQKLSDQIKD